MRYFAVAAFVLASMVPSAVRAGYVFQPRDNDPNPPAIVATDDELDRLVLDRFGQTWLVMSGAPWIRRAEEDPPFPVSELLFWNERALITTAGEVFLYAVGEGWTSEGFPPSASSAPESNESATGSVSARPNPTSAGSAIVFSTAIAGPVSVRVFDIAGRTVRTILEADLPPGQYAPSWDGLGADGRVVPNGVYFTRVESASGTAAGRVTIAR